MTIFSANLVHPFSLTYPPLTHESVKGVQQLISIAWPRILYYRGEVLRALTMSWLSIQEDGRDSSELKEIRNTIEASLKMLSAILGKGVDVSAEYQMLIDSDSRLQKLLLP